MPKLSHATPDRTKWLPLLLVAAAVAAYANSFDGAFLLDDHRSIERNARIHQLWPLGPVLSGRRPVVDLTLAVNYAFGGLNVAGYHAVNLLIHIFSGLTLYGILRRTFSRCVSPASPFLPLVAAVIWVVHPLQTESVTYVIQRSESLMGLFYLLTLYCVIRGSDSPRAAVWYAMAVACSFLGMGSKAVMVTAPVVVLLFDRVFLSPTWAQLVRRRGLLYVGLAATWIVLFTTNVAPRVLFPSAEMSGTVGFAYRDVTSIEYALTQAGVIRQYLLLSLWPSGLCLDHGWPIARTVGTWLPYVCEIGALLLVTGWALARRPWLGFLGAWFFLILAPTSSVIPIKDPLFEHRMYLPLASIVVLGVVVGRAALRVISKRLALEETARLRLTVALVVMVVGALIIGTARRNRVYATELSMWSDVVAKKPRNERARFNLGRAQLDRHDYESAISAFREALRLDPDFAPAHYNLGKTFSQVGRIDEAERSYRDALRVDPDLPQAHSDLGNILAKAGKTEEAIDHYREAIRVDPRYVRSYFNLGSVLLKQGKTEEAVEILRRAVKLEPGAARIHFLLGRVLHQAGDIPGAIEEYRKTLELAPDHARARQRLDRLRRR